MDKFFFKGTEQEVIELIVKANEAGVEVMFYKHWEWQDGSAVLTGYDCETKSIEDLQNAIGKNLHT